MPQFPEFQYYFALSELEITKFSIGLITVYSGFFMFVKPFLYQKYLGQIEFRTLFKLGQLVFILTDISWLLICLDLYAPMGFSNTFVFSFTQTCVHTIGHGLTMMPSFILLARVIPPGFESTMMAISAAIIQFNISTLRNLIGVLLNYLFVGVSKDNFKGFYILI